MGDMMEILTQCQEFKESESKRREIGSDSAQTSDSGVQPIKILATLDLDGAASPWKSKLTLWEHS